MKQSQLASSHNFLTSKFLTLITRSYFIVHLVIISQILPVRLWGQERGTILTSSIQGKSSNQSNQKLTLTYNKKRFKSGDEDILKPLVNIKGGVFTVKSATVDSPGGLTFNQVTGWIICQFSDPGRYLVTYSLKDQKATFEIIVD